MWSIKSGWEAGGTDKVKRLKDYFVGQVKKEYPEGKVEARDWVVVVRKMRFQKSSWLFQESVWEVTRMRSQARVDDGEKEMDLSSCILELFRRVIDGMWEGERILILHHWKQAFSYTFKASRYLHWWAILDYTSPTSIIQSECDSDSTFPAIQHIAILQIADRP